MNLKTMNVHEVKGSCFIYIPKIWLKMMKIKKGDKLVWSVKEGDHKTLILKKSIGE